MRVGINLMWLVPDMVGGTEYAMVSLLDALAKFPEPGLEIILFVSAAFVRAHPQTAARFRLILPPHDPRNTADRVIAEKTGLARQAKRLDLDVIHRASTKASGSPSPKRHPSHHLRPCSTA
jgi:hypothetical protein